MAIQYADVLYPVNSTTVDTAAGIDIRLLSSAEAGATDSTQSVRFLHTNDGVERTFDPATGLVTAIADAGVFQGEGWALRLAEDHTPVDDTNCNSILKAGTLVVQVRCLMNMNGGTGNAGANPTNFTFRAALYRYDTSANTGTLISSGSLLQAWNTLVAGGDNNTRKNITISVIVASDVEFLANEVLLLQIGVLSGTLPNPLSGTTNFDVTLDVDDPATFLDFAGAPPQDITDQGIRQVCTLNLTATGEGLVSMTRATVASKTFNLIGEGLVSMIRATVVSKTFDLIGEGLVSMTRAVVAFKTFSLIGEGLVSMTRVVVASQTFTLLGEGFVSPATRALTLTRTAIGEGLVSFTRATIATKTFDLIGEGLVTFTKSTQAQRTFDLIGEGVVTMTRVVAASKTFDLIGEGLISMTRVVVASKTFNLIGEGLISMTKGIVASKTFDLIGEGLVTFIKSTQAQRTFSLIGKGHVVITGANASTVTIPIDEIPICEGGGGGTTIIKKSIFVFDD